MKKWSAVFAVLCLGACSQQGASPQLPPGLCGWPGLVQTVEGGEPLTSPLIFSSDNSYGTVGGSQSIMDMPVLASASCGTGMEGGSVTGLIVDQPFAETWEAVLSARSDLDQAPDGYGQEMPYTGCFGEWADGLVIAEGLPAAVEDSLELGSARIVPLGAYAPYEGMEEQRSLVLASTRQGRTAMFCVSASQF